MPEVCILPQAKRVRSGTTLIELIIFLGILSIIIAAAFPMLFSATENRLLQQTISVVEQSGTQMMQNVTLRIRQAERIVSPAMGQTGSVLVLHTADATNDPMIIGLSSGSMVIVERTTRELISSPQVAVQNVVFRNTSTSATRQSVSLSFNVSRTIRLQQPHSYRQWFQMMVTLLPDDIIDSNTCNCAVPYCSSSNTYNWYICSSGMCLEAATQLECP